MKPAQILLLAALLLGSALGAQAQVGSRLYPVDEATRDPSFFSFRLRLIEALAARDTSFLYAHVSPQIKNGFGGDEGIEAFKEIWEPGRPESRLWSTLLRVVAAGGKITGDEGEPGERAFTAPYTFTNFPGAEFDAFEHGVIVGENVRVRNAPTTGSETLAALSFEIVRVPDWQPVPDRELGDARSWLQVRLADGRAGYVAEPYLWSPIGYRARFVHTEGGWMMDFLLAGD